MLMLLGAIFILDESPRYLFINGKYDESFKIIDKMIIENKGDSNHNL